MPTTIPIYRLERTQREKRKTTYVLFQTGPKKPTGLKNSHGDCQSMPAGVRWDLLALGVNGREHVRQCFFHFVKAGVGR